MRKIVLDANFLILPFQFNVDIFSEFDRLLGNEPYEVYTLNRTYNEALNVEDGKYGNMVRRLVEESNPRIEIITVKGTGDVDDVLVQLAGEHIIATNDRELKKRLRAEDLPHIYLRQENHLEGQFLRNAGFY